MLYLHLTLVDHVGVSHRVMLFALHLRHHDGQVQGIRLIAMFASLPLPLCAPSIVSGSIAGWTVR